MKDLLSSIFAKEESKFFTDALDALEPEENNNDLPHNSAVPLWLEKLRAQRHDGDKGGSSSVGFGYEERKVSTSDNTLSIKIGSLN